MKELFAIAIRVPRLREFRRAITGFQSANSESAGAWQSALLSP